MLLIPNSTANDMLIVCLIKLSYYSIANPNSRLIVHEIPKVITVINLSYLCISIQKCVCLKCILVFFSSFRQNIHTESTCKYSLDI